MPIACAPQVAGEETGETTYAAPVGGGDGIVSAEAGPAKWHQDEAGWCF